MSGSVYEGDYAILAAAFSADGASLELLGADLRRFTIPINPLTKNKAAEISAEIMQGKGKPRVYGLRDTSPSPMTTFSADGDRMVTLRVATDDGRILIGIARRGDTGPTLIDPRGTPPPSWCVDLASDGRRFVTSGVGDQIYVWNFDNKSVEKVIRNEEHATLTIPFVAFSRDSSRVISIDAQGILCVWDVDSGKQLFTQNTSITDPRDAALVGDHLTVVYGGIHHGKRLSIPLSIRTFDLKRGEAASSRN
jgi:hypothetical protein